MFGIEPSQFCGQLVAEVKAVQPALMALHRRPRPVAGQFEQRMLGAEFGGPVIELAQPFARLQPLALPHAVVEVLHGQRQQRRGAIIHKRFVQLAQFAGKNIHRPAFSDDVMQGQDKVVLAGGGLDHMGAQ